ncbi:MAG: hypothetical protein OXH56_06040 [Gemmatimonadetes bacterium]|nr:hypothetical protein [Gemmatimonadota bacterium]
MKYISGWAIGAAVLLLCEGGISAGRAQYDLDPRTISQLKEVIAGAEQDKQYRVERSAYSKNTPPVLSEKGLVLISSDNQTLRALDHKGTTLWEFTPLSKTTYSEYQIHQVGLFGSLLTTSLDGRFLMFSNKLSWATESISNNLLIVLDSEWGTPLFMRFPDPVPRFSSSEDYLISGVYWFEGPSPSPVKVYETQSGKTLWTHDVEAVVITELGSNEVAYINTADRNAVLTIVKLATGEHVLTTPIKWLVPEKSREPCQFWKLTTSKDGTRFLVSVSDYCFDGPLTSYQHSVMFDREGRPLWNEMRQIAGVDAIVGNAIGFSPNSRYLLFKRWRRSRFETQHDQLIMADTDTGDILWSLNVDNLTSYDLMLMTDDYIVLSHSYKSTTLILSIDESGQIRDQAQLDRRIVWTGLRVDKPVSDMPQKRYRHSLLFEEVEQDSITYKAEYVPFSP